MGDFKVAYHIFSGKRMNNTVVQNDGKRKSQLFYVYDYIIFRYVGLVYLAKYFKARVIFNTLIVIVRKNSLFFIFSSYFKTVNIYSHSRV